MQINQFKQILEGVVILEGEKQVVLMDGYILEQKKTMQHMEIHCISEQLQEDCVVVYFNGEDYLLSGFRTLRRLLKMLKPTSSIVLFAVYASILNRVSVFKCVGSLQELCMQDYFHSSWLQYIPSQLQYGVEYEHLLHSPLNQIQRCMEYFNQDPAQMRVEGLFRKCAIEDEIKSMLKYPPDTLDGKNPHLVACYMKRLLQKTPIMDENGVPKDHVRYTSLITFLKQIASIEENRMDTLCLSIVFAPCLTTDIHQIKHITQQLQHILSN